MNFKEVATLPDQLYSSNKTKIKSLFKKYGLKFNQGACLSANLYLWQGEGIQVEGKFTKNAEGVTIHAELIVTSEERSEIFDQLRSVVEKLGGSWSVAEEEEVKEESAKQDNEERAKFMKEWKNNLANEERKARKMGMKKCPIIDPMISKFIEELKQRFPDSEVPTKEAVYEAVVRELERE
jgi:hypothetical protein